MGSRINWVEEFAGHADLSADGETMMFRSRDGEGRPTLVICKLPTCSDTRALAINATAYRWSPDGGIAYVDLAEPTNIRLRSVNSESTRPLTRYTDGATINDFAWWSHDGKHLGVARFTIADDLVLFRNLDRLPP